MPPRDVRKQHRRRRWVALGGVCVCGGGRGRGKGQGAGSAHGSAAQRSARARSSAGQRRCAGAPWSTAPLTPVGNSGLPQTPTPPLRTAPPATRGPQETRAPSRQRPACAQVLPRRADRSFLRSGRGCHVGRGTMTPARAHPRARPVGSSPPRSTRPTADSRNRSPPRRGPNGSAARG